MSDRHTHIVRTTTWSAGPGCHGLEDLLVGEPARVIDKVIAQECEKDVARAKDDRGDFEKG